MVYRNVIIIMKISRFFGLSPFWNSKSDSVFPLCVLQMFYVTLLVLLFAYLCYMNNFLQTVMAVFPWQKKIRRLSTIFEFFSVTVIVLSSWLCCFIFSRKMLIFVDAFSRVEKLFLLMGVEKFNHKYSFSQAPQMVLVICVVSLHYFLEYLENGHKPEHFLIVSLYIIFIYQFVNVMLGMRAYFCCINNYLCQIYHSRSLYKLQDREFITRNQYMRIYTIWKAAKFQNKLFPENLDHTSTNPNLNVAQVMKEIHRYLSELCTEINSYYATQLLLCFLLKLLSITLSLYYLSSFKVQDLHLTLEGLARLYPVINKGFVFASNLLQLVLIVFACVKTTEEASFTGILVHGLLNSDLQPRMRKELMIFSQQILHQKITFTAAGFFVIDFTLINNVIGAVTTYLVILIQFQLST
ncbi:putative gustatory receptor 28b isoform X1 [Nilaparvata lugens]|uniref:putative gustatory receptor 28b isoform X1 n=1 Tax=Nilaparvata lugens TaxID=108931 RepID=UPI00193E8CD1|nr:putative gustatory receptor 28b isoform X1 [Nilaparvata lugens]